jgi:hypothetical protein
MKRISLLQAAGAALLTVLLQAGMFLVDTARN